MVKKPSHATVPLSQHLFSYWLAQLDIGEKIRLNIHFALHKKEKGGAP